MKFYKNFAIMPPNKLAQITNLRNKHNLPLLNRLIRYATNRYAR